jgi:predicted DNA-binding transcriptional regulator YafY
MRASRLLSVLLLLQNRGRMSARELAGELEVSVRTVYRDVEALGAAGVPIYADRGPSGGYQLLDGYRTRLTGMTDAEAESLFLAGMPGPAAELGLGAVLAAAELKLRAALPADLGTRVGRLRERFHLDPAGWFQAPDDTPHLAAAAEAVWQQRLVRLRYRRWKIPREVTRVLEPLGVVLKAGRWYLVAAADGRVRTYRVGQILGVEAMEATFERPDGFDLAAYWSAWAERFEAGVHRGEATVRLSPRAMELLPGLFGTTVSRAAAATAGPADGDGWVEAVIPVEHPVMAAGDLLRLGTDVEVLAPPELRERVAAIVRALAGRYDGPAPQPGPTRRATTTPSRSSTTSKGPPTRTSSR